MKIIAHRGYRAKYTENTMTAFKKAIQAGADGIELDIHLSSDKELIVFHDNTFRRMARLDTAVNKMTTEQIKKVRLTKGLKSERVPLLKEVLSLLDGKDIMLNIEIKTLSDGYLEEKLVEELKRYDIKQLVISSFHAGSIRRVKELDRTIETALLYSKYIDQPWKLQSHFKFDAIHTDTNYTSKEYAALIQSHSIPVRIYTVNREKDLKYWLDSEVDALITDEVERAIALQKEK
ncbi:hypothetical protein ERX37_02295 [Macrococcus hajekii]|uniref:GP-PDE domain-containing protein n=1 Tax=Macrococcus hajekii TaxID=198482 RepID=A0A4R6BMI4_9STAP|nr:glycerophosphodiester phosphodiesterase family protein [Macrococcus hajekii]TDM02938.1 hypothetical protein ERX37_02295 [Macrococcus hajekii]GGB05087.1 glycerophosphoryl diester phosphodiesterase [Macrococcus hajekii]